MRQRGIKLPDDSEVRRAAEKIHRDALVDIDRRRPIASQELRVLECELEERDRPRVIAQPAAKEVARVPGNLVPVDLLPETPPKPTGTAPRGHLVPVDFAPEPQTFPWANDPQPSCADLLRKERAK